MSTFRLSAIRAPAQRSLVSRAIGASRSFQSCQALAAGKESELHNESRADEAEAEKQKQVQKAKDGKGEWSDSLSSDSESAVKADRGEMQDTSEAIKELEREKQKVAGQKK